MMPQRILVVDDEPSVMSLLAMILVGEGYIVLQATTREEALSAGDSHEGTIALLITDHLLLNASGKEIAEHMLKTRPEMKIIHMSGKPQAALIDEGGLTPGAAFLQKPFAPKDLIKVVHEVLGGPV